MSAEIEWSARTRHQEERLPLRGAACIVEPDEMERDLLAGQLRAMGFAAHETGCGTVGQFIADQIHLSAIVVNVMTDDVSGLRLIRRLRRKAPDAAIVALSPDVHTGLCMVLARVAGADAVLAAPPTNEALGAALTDALDAHGRHV